jgi:hypothetical protein
MDESMRLTLSHCTVGHISEILGPYVRDYFRRDGRSRERLGIFVASSGNSVSIRASTIGTANGSAQRVTFATFTVVLGEYLHPLAEDRLCVDFVACTPTEHVVYFGGALSMDIVKGIASVMPKLQELYLIGVTLSDGFLQPDPDGSLANTKLLPSLRCQRLERIVLEDHGWTPLLPYLSHQTSGGQVISLTLSGGHIHICKDVVKEIEGLVKEFILI